MRYEIVHRTRYQYAAPVRESFNEVRLSPVSNEHQTLDSFLLKVMPPSRLRHYTDFYANIVHHFEIPEQHPTLLIESQLRITTHPVLLLNETSTPLPLTRLGEASREPRCYDFLQASRFVDVSAETWKLALDAIGPRTDAWQAALALMRFVHGHLRYTPNSTSVHTHMREALLQRAGVCQDYAHILIGLCRVVKIPALYVSGYLATETASATHAWVEVYLPETGWIALDPTHNCQPGETYVKIAVGRDYADVPPVSGDYRGTRERKMDVEVEVKPLG